MKPLGVMNWFLCAVLGKGAKTRKTRTWIIKCGLFNVIKCVVAKGVKPHIFYSNTAIGWRYYRFKFWLYTRYLRICDSASYPTRWVHMWGWGSGHGRVSCPPPGLSGSPWGPQWKERSRWQSGGWTQHPAPVCAAAPCRKLRSLHGPDGHQLTGHISAHKTQWVTNSKGVCVCVCYLEQAASILVTQVYVDHLQQCVDFFIAHLVVVVLVSPAQVSMNPGDPQT